MEGGRVGAREREVAPALWARRTALALLLLAGLALSDPAMAATAGASGQRGKLARELGPGVRVSRHDGQGRVRFIATQPGRPIDRPATLSASAAPTRAARAFLGRYGDAFGLDHVESDLRVTSQHAARGGRSVVRLQQLQHGVPVIGGELVVNLDSRDRVLSAGGEVLPGTRIDAEPRVSRSRAVRTARAVVSREYDIPASRLDASRPELSIYARRLLGGPGLDRPTLVWNTEVTSGPLAPIRELVLVDAKLGGVPLHFNQVAEARNRKICDANNTTAQVPCTSPVRVEGGPPSAVADVNSAYDFAGDTYGFYSSRFGRDSVDDDGLPLLFTVRACTADPEDGCPMNNGFWNGEQVVIGTDVAQGDDFIGHELTHAVTQYESNLYYYFQSGAINESISDVFGEFIDLTNGAGTDTPATRWLFGEDTPGGASRDMQDPTSYGDPDRTTSPRYEPDFDERDNGGVHANSGVNNKAAYLLTDGGTFNGRTVTGLGISKVARIYYEANSNLLTSAGDYADLYDALRQACSNLVGTGGITASDCVQVRNAGLAVDMNQNPPNASAPEAPVCDGGARSVSVFRDDLENPASGKWTKINGSGGQHWHYPQSANPYHFDAPYATSGKENFWGEDWDDSADYSIAMAHPVRLPKRAYLRFNHAHGFDNDLFRSYDGGVVEYKTKGHPWKNAGRLFTDNGYNGRIATGTRNPLAGRDAFVAQSNGYISSRLKLSSLAGKKVRFRFRIGTDFSVGDEGWYIDDVRIYKCARASTPPDHARPTARAPRAEFSRPTVVDDDALPIPVRIWWPAGSDNRTQVGDLEYRLTASYNGGSFQMATGWTGDTVRGLYLARSGDYRFRIIARDEAGNVSEPATAQSFSVVVRQEDSPVLDYGPGWGARLAQGSAFGGFVKPTIAANAEATMSFSAQSIGVVVPVRANLGELEFCLLDGATELCGHRDLSQLAPGPRILLVGFNKLDPTKTYGLRVGNASGRIELDAVVLLK